MMSNNKDKAERLLRRLHEKLSAAPSEAVGKVALEGGRLTAHDGELRFAVDFPEDPPDTAVQVVHAHVTVGFANGADPFTACIVTLSGNEKEPYEQTAERWLALAAPPIFSHFLNREVLGAKRFAKHDAWGVPGGMGFVGPLGATTASADEESLLRQLSSQPLFLNALELAGLRGTHMAKATFSCFGGGWKRALEMDDHLAAIPDSSWPPPFPGVEGRCGEKAPAGTVAICFSVFSRRPETAPDSPMETVDQAVAWLSPELDCINQALWNESDPADLIVLPPLVETPGIDENIRRRAIRKINAANVRALRSKVKKWWQFWK